MQCRHSPPAYLVALMLFLIALCCNLIALPIDRLSTVTVTSASKNSEWDSYCGWEELHHGATIKVSGEREPSDSAYCGDYDVFCSAGGHGKVWLALGLVSLCLGLASWAAMMREL